MYYIMQEKLDLEFFDLHKFGLQVPFLIPEIFRKIDSLIPDQLAPEGAV